ncbi:M23 family metallopeptidase [Marinospirillum alkaliphilum]|uniref:Peptidase family M23 n=1 Tax=Marinospirillum alkaliphilum DSM 21637 TaxID=1122209 RepID=A0A1K1TRT9_9GAMM|nr:M23 family metallopeptidase [Marinospirillum alkaliphilum]SFX03415.1 Peptidase family M23 [Marinospirillum alkaliphilum DSM 21637]
MVFSVVFMIPAAMGGMLVYWWVDASERMMKDQASLMWTRELEAQRQEVEDLKRKSLERIDALTPKIGELQARLFRLDALGKRLTSVANLSDEFDFDQPPPLGGPEYVFEESSGYTDSELMEALDSLNQKIEQRQQQLELIHSLLTNRSFAEQVYIAGRPIERGWMSSPFGRRSDPFTGRSSWHEGIDYAGKENSNVIATGAGVVVFASRRGGFGKLVEIDHGDGYLTRYAHLNDFKVAKGDIVQRGDVIGLMGCTGRCTGTHVHYEILRNGRAVDPVRYVSRAAP